LLESCQTLSLSKSCWVFNIESFPWLKTLLSPFCWSFAELFLCQNLAEFLIFESFAGLKTLLGPFCWSLARLFLCQNLAGFLINKALLDSKPY